MSTTRYEIEIVAIPEQHLACLRSRTPLSGVDDLAGRLDAAFASAGLEPAGALQARIYDDTDPDDADVEVCRPLAPDDSGWTPDAVGEALVTITPAHHAMATTHAGPRETVGEAHAAIRRELAAVGYTQAGPASETYVSGGSAEPEGAGRGRVTVVCYPYAR